MNELYTVAFYNVENLFDTLDDKYTRDDDFLPDGDQEWTVKRYNNKIHKIARAITKIGYEESERRPSLLGLAEVENEKVLNDLLNTDLLMQTSYNFVHYESLDERGMDVALVYNEEEFELLDSEIINIAIYEKNGERDYTRDALYCSGILNGELIHIIVTHWPSRGEGMAISNPKRKEVARQIVQFIERHEKISADSKLIIMGDFNDNPNDENVEEALVGAHASLYNPFVNVMHHDRGSLNYRDEWYLFDQIIISHNFFKMSKKRHQFLKANIFDNRMLQEWDGHEKGEPYRTYKGVHYNGGYSDHFPVYVILKLIK